MIWVSFPSGTGH